MTDEIRILTVGLIFAWSFNVNSQTSLAALAGEMVIVEAVDFNWRGLPTKLPNDYYICKYEVTQGLWEEVTGFNPSVYNASGQGFPVENVSWYDCCVFCNQLSERIGMQPCYFADDAKTVVYGKTPGGAYEYTNSGPVHWKRSANGFRLPMECEWEYAASGGKLSKGKVFAGSDQLDEVAWYDGNNIPDGTKKVGTKLPNELGLFDMSGNVEEWVYDVHVQYYGDLYIVFECQTNGRGFCVPREGVILYMTAVHVAE